MSNDNRGSIYQTGNMMRVDNALVEEVYSTNNETGYLLVSYAASKPNKMTSIELLRLNISKNTLILNSSGVPISLKDITRGMWIDSLISPAMTRSIPPQSNAFIVAARRDRKSSLNFTINRIAKVDTLNKFLYTGNPKDINSQMRFVISNPSVIRDKNGKPISLNSLKPGQKVIVIHPNFQTASIPPQTTAFHIQLM